MSFPHIARRFEYLCLLGIGFAPIAAHAQERPILSLIPADSAVVFTAKRHADWSDPAPAGSGGASESSTGGQLGAILTFLNTSGLIPREGQVFADIAARLPLLGRYEHALTLLDVSSRIIRREGASKDDPSFSLRLEQLHVAAVFRTGGQNKEVLSHLERIVGRYTNSELAELSTQRIGDHSYQRLVDRRMDDWAVWEWGRLDEFYVITFGRGTFARVAHVFDGQAPNLNEDEWFRRASAATRGDRALARWFISLARIEQDLANIAGERYRRVIRAIGAENLSHDLWTIGRDGRALSWFRFFRRDGKDQLHAYSDPAKYPSALKRLVPGPAKRYAIINVPTRWLVDSLPNAWLQAQSEGHIQRIQAAWERLESETGIDIGKNLIDHLGKNVVIFDYPQHPLKIPIACTVAIEIGNRKAVETALDALLGAWSRYLDEGAKRKGTTLVRLHVRRDESDGIWYIQAGILGPALKVTDGFLVISWSPTALRDALKHIERASPVKSDP